MSLRIDVTQKRDVWQLGCPECGSRDWRADNGSFECRACGTVGLEGLEHVGTGEFYAREDIEFVGKETSWKAPYAARRRRS
ncbi:MAG: TFIIB-type zinc finger domain-containing protein [Salinivenus sp.]